MSKKMIISRPNYDLNTSYLFDFSNDFIKIVKHSRDIHVTDLEGKKATRELFEKHLQKEKPTLLFLNGHGNRYSVLGHNDETILDEKNISFTKNSIIYALSCDSLEGLGKISIERGTKAYIGYKARFMIISDPSHHSIPNKDTNALPFKRACTILINGLVSGFTVQEALEETKQEYIHSIRAYTKKDDPFGDTPLIRFALTWNLLYLGMYGDPNAVF